MSEEQRSEDVQEEVTATDDGEIEDPAEAEGAAEAAAAVDAQNEDVADVDNDEDFESDEEEDDEDDEEGLITKVLRSSSDESLPITSIDRLNALWDDDYQVQLYPDGSTEGDGTVEPFVFAFKPISPDFIMLQIDTPIIPELEKYTRPPVKGKKPPVMPPELIQKRNKAQAQYEYDLMVETVAYAVTEPKIDRDMIKRLPRQMFRALFNAIWRVSSPVAAEDYMAIFQSEGSN